MSYVDDFTMGWASGSAVLLVEGKLFRVPKAILQQHSSVFGHMFASTTSTEETDPITLDDSLQAFEDFRAMLFTPLQSCLMPSYPTTKDLRRMLEILVLLHKYEISDFEKHILSLIEPLLEVLKLKSPPPNTPSAYDVFRVAHRVGQIPFVDFARSVIIDRLWDHDPAFSAYEALFFGEEYNDKPITGAAYYQILLLGEEAWRAATLSTTQLDKLVIGRLRCIDLWHELFAAICTPGQYPIIHDCCWGHDAVSFSMDRYGLVFYDLAKAKRPSFDWIGMLEIFITRAEELACDEDCRQRYRPELEEMKQSLYDLFEANERFAEPPIVDAGLETSA
ncbi:hypothetical protein DL93DRAFT_2164110 [Clavulina sp. PMI_390]|nr:hypothetical protein DL93DRAFT_2164110 [Clavulina sp. PMI_390]